MIRLELHRSKVPILELYSANQININEDRENCTVQINPQKDLQILYKNGALGAGSDLWILPEKPLCLWYDQMDWYLNFQLTKSKNHLKPSISPKLGSLLLQHQISIEPFQFNSQALMVASLHNLPCKQIIEVSGADSLENWFQEIYSCWKSLSFPSLRIFLPHNFNTSDFKKYWPDTSSTEAITLVP